MDAETALLGVAATLGAYLVGAIPWGIIIARLAAGPDPRTIGSGRTGGANVMRALGLRWALLASGLDLLKGALAVLLARAIGAGTGFEILAALAAILGHSRSIFIGFGGGRGVAPAVGSLIVVAPVVTLVTLPVYLVVMLSSGYSSLGSLTASALAGVLVVGLVVAGHLAPVYVGYAVGGAGLIWLFHLDNIQRLLTGEERRMSFRR